MSTAANFNSIVLGPPNRPQDLRPPQPVVSKASPADKAEKLHSTFTQFVGQTFFGQMIKSMRSTVGPAAYFNGGQAEKIFQSQLDQTIADQMTKASAERFADPMFHRQFPNVDLEAGNNTTPTQGLKLGDLSQLARR
jgi:Rod binding domain-containing protein